MTEAPPDNAPRCWSRQYQDGDPECKQCPFNFSCKTAFLRNASAQPTTTTGMPAFSLPTIQNVPPPSYGYPPQPMYQAPPQQQQRPWQPTWQAPTQPQQMQQRQQPGYVYANAAQDQMAFQQQFHQYPGETVSQRVGKNIVLRAFEAVFAELTRFFHYWTWPSQR